MAKYKKSYYKLLQETIDFYSEDTSKRGMNDGENESGNEARCAYLSPISGNMCAVGRCMTEELVQKAGISNHDVDGLISELEVKDVDELLKPKYRGFNRLIWLYMQSLHDCNGNWDDSGLTEEGECAVADIKVKINDIIFA